MTRYLVCDAFGNLRRVSLVFGNLKVGSKLRCTIRGIVQTIEILEVLKK